ncbi:hypothetical protein [Phormidium sp. CCY1219]|uniref:hypothetical protein n=1 Tax=Phormidium sp. CCY1219 TaxID=2886104 RepID=UPI002D1EE2EE|nr:hypothetical protein [Phormidium sp. CCY1219]MEB3831891.1 hypothetical protein [Phormidium sp. CCY1219]
MQFKFYKGDRVQWIPQNGEEIIVGTIEKIFKEKCWLQPAGVDRVGEIIKGIPLDEIELYSSESKSGTGCNLEFIQGQEQHSSTWAKFYVRGLEEWQVKEDGRSDNHSNYLEYVCLDVPENTVFTVFEQDGTKRGTDGFHFWICKTSREINRIEADYESGAMVSGNFEIVCHGEGKTKAPRLMDWWVGFTGKSDDKGRSQTQKLAFAYHCAENINKRGLKKIPDFSMPESPPAENPPVQVSDAIAQPVAIAQPKPETFWLNIDEIHEHPSFQPRGADYQALENKGIDDDVVAQYAEWLEFSEPPAIEVWFGAIADSEEQWWLLAGHHRIRALKKAERDRVECFCKASTYEEAVYRASVSNAGDERARQIYKMRRHEWGEACKQFLRVCDRLSENAIEEFLDRAALLTGQSKRWSKLNDSAIAAVFGVSRSSVIQYRKAIELEKEMVPFQKGDRVLAIDNCPDLIYKHRLGTVVRKSSEGLYIEFDYHRISHGNFLPKHLKIVDELPFQQHQFKPGDRVWKDNQFGTVVCVEEDKQYSGYEFGVWSPGPDNPVVFWDCGIHTCELDLFLDFEGAGEVPEIEFRVSKMRDYISSIEEDESLENHEKISLRDKLEKQIKKLSPDNCQSEFTSIEQEDAAKRKELLGRSRPAGTDGAELPDKDFGENPETVVGKDFEVDSSDEARLNARLSAARNAIANLKIDLAILPNSDLVEILNAVKIELANRHRPN